MPVEEGEGGGWSVFTATHNKGENQGWVGGEAKASRAASRVG